MSNKENMYKKRYDIQKGMKTDEEFHKVLAVAITTGLILWIILSIIFT